MLACNILLKPDVLGFFVFFFKSISMNNCFLSIHLQLLGKLSVCVGFGFGGRMEKHSRDTDGTDRERAPSHPRATSQKCVTHGNTFFV